MGLMGRLFGDKGDGKKKGRASGRKKASGTREKRPKTKSGVKRPSSRKTASVVRKPRTRSTVVVPKGKAAAAQGAGAPTQRRGSAGRPDDRDTTHRKRASMKGKQLGALLLKNESVTEAQLEAALAHQQEKGGLLGQILIRADACKKADIGTVLKKQRTITTVLLPGVAFDAEALELLPRDFCIKHRLIPFEKIGSHLCLAMANVLDTQAKNDIKEMTKLQLKTFDAGWHDIEAAIKEHMGEAGPAAAGTEPAVSEPEETVEDLVIELPEEELIEGVTDLPAAAEQESVGAAEPEKMTEPAAAGKGEQRPAPAPAAEEEVIEDLSRVGIEEVSADADTVNVPPRQAPGKKVAAVEEIEEIAPLAEVEAIEDVEEISVVEESDEVAEVAAVEEVAPTAEVEAIEDVEEIAVVEAIGEVAEVAAVEEVATIAEVEAIEDIEEAPAMAAIDEVADVAAVEEVAPIAEVEAIEDIEEAPAVAAIDEVAGIAEVEAALPAEEAGTSAPAKAGLPLPETVLDAIPLSQGYFSEVVQWGAADAERRWLAEHLADNVLPVLPAPELKAS